MSKSYRLVEIAHETIKARAGFDVDMLDLSRMTSEYGRQSSLQGLRIDVDAALSLALQLLSESRARPDGRLDERNLSALGGRARRADRDAGPLVSGPGRVEADDRPPGLRRRRQSRSDARPTARRRRRPRPWNWRAGPIPGILPAASSPSSCMATPWARSRCGARCPTGRADMRMVPAGPKADVDRFIGYYEPYAPATKRSTATLSSRPRSRTPIFLSWKRWRPSAPGGWSRLEVNSRSHDRNSRGQRPTGGPQAVKGHACNWNENSRPPGTNFAPADPGRPGVVRVSVPERVPGKAFRHLADLKSVQGTGLLLMLLKWPVDFTVAVPPDRP